MAHVISARLKVPMCLGGDEAEPVAARLRSIGMNVKPSANALAWRRRSKCARSVIIKESKHWLSNPCLRRAGTVGEGSFVFASRRIRTGMGRCAPIP